MDMQTWLLFAGSTFLISATPGSNMLLAFQSGVNYGVRQTLYTLVGLSTGLLLLLSASLLLLDWFGRHPLWFELLKAAAALYLAYLGWKMWRTAQADWSAGGTAGEPSGRLKRFQTGVAVSLSNPKAILFFAALFPKFLNPAADLLPQYGVLTVSFFVIETFWQLVYAAGGRSLAAWLGEGRRLLYLNRCCALVFVLIAGGLLAEMPLFR